MPFFAPMMLLALGFAAVPILLHIFRRRNARRVSWGAWMFLASSHRERRRRMKVEEYVLLAARTLILALAALAFARPFLPEAQLLGAGGMSRDVVLVMDTSASMGLRRADGKTAFEESVAEARELVRSAPRDTAFAVIDAGAEATGGHPQVVTASLFTDKAEVYAALDSLRVGAGTMAVPETLALAAEVLTGGNNPAKEVVIFGDGQAYGWQSEAADEWQNVEQLMNRFQLRPVVVWRLPERPERVRNAAIESVTPSRRIIGTDRPVGLAVNVLNSGSEAVNPGDVTLSVNGQVVARRSVGQVLPALAKAVEFSYRFPSNGLYQVVTALSAADDLMADNCVTNPVEVLDTLGVVLVNGHGEATGFDRPTAYLEAALMGGVTSRTVRAAALERREDFTNAAVVALCDVPLLSPRAATNLAEFVRGGGGLLLFPGERARRDFYADWRLEGERVVPGVWTNFAGRALFDERALTNGVEAVRRSADGAAAFVVSRLGSGKVGVWAEPPTMDFGVLPSRPEFVPLVHELVYELVATNSVTALVDTRRRSREGDLAPLNDAALDLLRSRINLSLARLKDDVLAAVLGRSFGVEIWRPFAVAVLLLMLFELVFARWVDSSRRGERFAWWPRPEEWRRPGGYLRLLAFLALAWMLAHLVLVHDTTRTVHRRVAVLTDSSLSMRRYDLDDTGATNAATRLAAATNVTDRLLTALAKRYDVEPLGFGGETTDFAAALDTVLERIREEELAGCVFVSDGRQTAGAGVEAAARRLARLGAHVSTVLVGSESNRCDAAIEHLVRPDTVFLGDKVRLTATLRADALDGAKLKCRFLEDERELECRELTVTGAAWTEEVKFQHEPEAKGVHRYRVTLETDAAETETANNVWPADVVVSDDRTNVLLVDRRPRWEFRYLRNLFYARDKSVCLQYVLVEPDTLAGEVRELPPASATRPFDAAEAGGLPVSREEWRRFDVIVLGDVSPETLTPQVTAELKYLVEERGAAVVFIGGERELPLKYALSELAGLFPVAVTNAAGELVAKWRRGPTPLAVTPSGLAHPLLRLSDSESDNRAIWDSLPAWTAHLEGLTVRPGAEILAYDGDSTALATPLLVAQHRGRGKVLFLAADESWRLRYRKGDTYHHRFWGNVLRWGAGIKLPNGNRFARLGTDRIHYAPGDDAVIYARFCDREALPIEDARVTAAVTLPGGGRRELVLKPRAEMNGVYEGRLEGLEAAGDYAVKVECAAAAERLGEDYPQELETRFSMETGFEPVEFAHLSADRRVPELMARLTGGEVVTSADASRLERAFGEGRREVEERVETPLWSHPAVCLVLVLALIVVWIWRKRRGWA